MVSIPGGYYLFATTLLKARYSPITPPGHLQVLSKGYRLKTTLPQFRCSVAYHSLDYET